MVSEDAEKLNFHTLLVRMKNGIAALENSLVVLFKTKNDVLYSPAVALLSTYPKEMNISFRRYMYMSVHSSFICNSPNWETTQMPFIR